MISLETASWVLVALALFGLILNVKQRKGCFYLWGISNAGWTWVNYQSGQNAQAFLFAVYFLMAIWGYIEWHRKENR